MGIINMTPDSFSGDGLAGNVDGALAQARRLIDEGADMLDIGGESTRPGAAPVPEEDELDRVLPVVRALADFPIPVSIDTWKPKVMRAALAAGASVVNDINGLREPGAIEAVAASDCAVCVMHMQGSPLTMQIDPSYRDVVTEVTDFLCRQAGRLEDAGVARARIMIDPGFGFGKQLEHNLALLRGLDHVASSGYPVLAGLSRKTMLGALTGRQIGARSAAGVAAALAAVARGAKIVRVHDVAATVDALAVWKAAFPSG